MSDCRTRLVIKAAVVRILIQNYLRSTAENFERVETHLMKKMSRLYWAILLVLVGQTFGRVKPAVRVRVTQKCLDYGMLVKCIF